MSNTESGNSSVSSSVTGNKTEPLFHSNRASIYPKQRLYFDKTEPLFHESNNSLYIRCQNKTNLLMKRSFLYVIFSLFLLLLPIGQTTANSNDSIRLSLLTCAPGEVIYTLFTLPFVTKIPHKGLTSYSITAYSALTSLTSLSASHSEKRTTGWE